MSVGMGCDQSALEHWLSRSRRADPSLSIPTGAETAWISGRKLVKESGGLFRRKADILGFRQQEAYVWEEICSPGFYFYFCSSV